MHKITSNKRRTKIILLYCTELVGLLMDGKGWPTKQSMMNEWLPERMDQQQEARNNLFWTVFKLGGERAILKMNE